MGLPFSIRSVHGKKKTKMNEKAETTIHTLKHDDIISFFIHTVRWLTTMVGKRFANLLFENNRASHWHKGLNNYATLSLSPLTTPRFSNGPELWEHDSLIYDETQGFDMSAPPPLGVKVTDKATIPLRETVLSRKEKSLIEKRRRSFDLG